VSNLQELPFLDVYAPDFVHNRARAIQAARTRSWVYQSQRGVEILSYAPQWPLLRDRRLTQDQVSMARDSGLTDPDVLRFRSEFLNATSGATHMRLRSAVARFFGKAYVETMRPVVRNLIDGLLDEISRDSTVDLLKLVCERVPALTYAHLVRAPLTDELFIARMSESILILSQRNPANRELIESAYHELFDYTERRFKTIENDPGDDLLSHLLGLVAEGKLTRREAMDLSILVLEASTDNTTHSMALVMSVLLEHGAEWAEIRRKPELIPQAVEEAIRVRPRFLVTERIAVEDFEWEGFDVPVGTRFVMSTLAANLDPEAYPRPDDFDIHRENPPVTTMFGSGMHACLGINLARVEMQEFVSALANRFPNMEAAGPATWRMDEYSTDSLGLAVVLA
jgi:cytochrome P450